MVVKCLLNLNIQNNHLKEIIMEATHNIKYEGLELEVSGEFEKAEPEVGYKGGWSYWTIQSNGVDISWMLKDDIINQINQIVIEENY